LKVQASQAPGVVAVAPVVGEDLSGLYRRLILGLGERDGLRMGRPVTAPEGLVGLIVEVEERRALVRTLLDPESQVGVRPEKV
ncbi:rod shape-determining protein MreC, partial [Acinetobacter baumannii]